MEAVFVLPLLLAVCAVIWWMTQPKRKKRDVATLRRELSNLTHDRDAAERLIEAEAKRSPDATELELLERVIKRLRYERRR